jgi:hypothetical protein
MTQNSDKNRDKRLANLKPFKPGISGNPLGRPEGSGYKQKWDRAITQIAESKGITKDEAEMELFKSAYEQALKGNFQYFKDTMDRIYGPVKQDSVSIGEVDKLVIVVKE